jgi:hypothetical protein
VRWVEEGESEGKQSTPKQFVSNDPAHRRCCVLRLMFGRSFETTTTVSASVVTLPPPTDNSYLVDKVPLLKPFSFGFSFLFVIFFLSLLIARDVNHFHELKENFILDYLNGFCIFSCLYEEAFSYSLRSLGMIIPYVLMNLASVLFYVIPNWRLLELSCGITYSLHHFLLISMVANLSCQIEEKLTKIIPALPVDPDLTLEIPIHKQQYEASYIQSIRQNKELLTQFRKCLTLATLLNISIIAVYVTTVNYNFYRQLTTFGSFTLWFIFSYKSLIPLATTVKYNLVISEYDEICTYTNSNLSVVFYGIHPTPKMFYSIIVTSLINLLSSWQSKSE